MNKNAIAVRVLRSVACVVAVAVLGGCDDWVQDVDDPFNVVPEDALATAELLTFQLRGVLGTFAETHDELTVQAGGLSDEQVFDRDLPQATFPSYDRLERGDFSADDGTINDDLGQMRFYADHLLEIVSGLEVPPEIEEEAREARFYGNFLGGVARAWYAGYLALEPEMGGGVIDNGPFIPSDQMYDSAVAKIETSLQYASPYQERVAHSTLARIHTYAGEYSAALEQAMMGLEPGDDPFQSLHSIESDNEWYFAAGEGRVQWRVNERFVQYVEEDPAEAARLPLFELQGRTRLWHIQDKWSERDSPITFIDWQETYLLMAELALRLDVDLVDPLALVNEVRASHGLDPLDSVDMEVLIEERDKELFARGQRLVDQRRFAQLEWHLPEGSWKYFPISQDERNNNPNIN